MFHTDTLKEIRMNTNTGVEYEIALFHSLLSIKPNEQEQVMEALSTRNDAAKIRRIIDYTSTRQIESALQSRGMSLVDVTFETQNDGIGPADIVMDVSCAGRAGRIGLSVKYANTCTLNVTGKNFITNAQIDRLRALLPDYTRMYIEEMTNEYGGVGNWFHKRKSSKVTDAYIDLIRDAVIDNWQYVPDKTTLLSTLFHSDSPIEFWVVTFFAMLAEQEVTACRKIFATINSNKADAKDISDAITYLENAKFFDSLNDASQRDKMFVKNIIRDNAVMLSNIAEVKDYLRSHVTDVPYYWFGSPSVQSTLNKMAEAKYNKDGYEIAFQKIDQMSAEDVKKYLKDLIKNNKNVGVEIIKNN